MRRLVGSILGGIGVTLMVVGGLIVAATINPTTQRKDNFDRELADIETNQWLTRTQKLQRLADLRQKIESRASDRRWQGPLLITIGSVMGGGGALLRRLGKRLAARRVEDLIAADSRPPVLLLRSFTDDTAGHVHEYRLPGFLAGSAITGLAASMEPIGFEEMLAEEFGGAGPLIAIGRPGEALPPVGAARTWLGHDDWQTRVTEYLGGCRFVVLIVGRIRGTEGLAWELTTVLDTVPAAKAIFVIPPVAEDEARLRWTDFHDHSAGRLPVYEPGLLAVGFSENGGCIMIRAEGDRFRLGKEFRRGLQRLLTEAGELNTAAAPGNVPPSAV